MARMLKRYWFYIVLLSTLVLQGQAQTTYPIQVNANLLPPYSAYLSDYYSGTREKLTLTLINRDQFKPTLNVRLRMIITAPGGLRLQTNEQAFIEPIMVENGAPVRLTQDDLAPYFQPQNLITQGYMASGKFPEGMVEFCFQAVEAYTGQALSLSTCTRAWITSQKPPLLSLPRNNESIVFREPLNVLFQWTPLHQGLAQVEYEFILKELWDNGMTPQAAFPYAPEIYRETTRSTSLVYGAMQPPLLAGKRYAWCVRAQARDGMDAVNLFQNDGYSEIRWFTLQDNCLPPEFVLATAEKKRLNVEWTALPDHIGFSVSYRVIKARSSDGKVDASEWKEQQSQEPKVILYGLQSGGTYEYRVASYCMAGSPVYSPIFSITLPETDSARLAQCGIMPDINLTNKEPIKELKTGDIIMANDYPVTVTKISGASGIYTGEGWTIVPWLNDAKIAVQFTSITVNTDKQMINGYIDAKYDKNEGQIANLDDVFEGGFDVGTVKTGITKIDHKVDFSIPGVEAFSLNDEGELVITDAEGEPHTITPANNEGQGNEGNKVVVFPMTVQDKDGNVYQVEKVLEKDETGKEVEKAKATYVGKVGTPLAEGSFDPSQLNGDKAIVTFARGEGIYGFDTWLDYYDNVSLIEGKYQKLYTDYYAPWKLVPAGKTDKVQATIVITDKNIKPEQVIFKTPKGTEYKATYENGIYKLQLAAGPAGDVQELYALYPNGKDKYYTLGKLNIVSYELQRQKVVLVPVNNVPVSKDAIQKALQDIYGPVGVTWDVVLDDNFDYTDNYRLMEQSTGLSTYNEDMRALNNAYKSARADEFDKAANYLFFLKATGSEQVNDRDATGFMPRGSQFGYIFTSEIKDANEPVTVAHELGHGRWKLFHTFDEHYGGYKKGETENVMDYNNGLHVAKWQWDIMNDPAMLVSVFEGDDDSEYITFYLKNIPKEYRNADGSMTFLSPSGIPVTIHKDAQYAVISTADPYFYTRTNKMTSDIAPVGSLIGFKVGDKAYTSRGPLLTYVDDNGGKYADDLSWISKPAFCLVGFPYYESGKIGFTIYKTNLSYTDFKEKNTDFGKISSEVFSIVDRPVSSVISIPDAKQNYLEYLAAKGSDKGVDIKDPAGLKLSPLAEEYIERNISVAGKGSMVAPIIISNAHWITLLESLESYVACDIDKKYNGFAQTLELMGEVQKARMTDWFRYEEGFDRMTEEEIQNMAKKSFEDKNYFEMRNFIVSLLSTNSALLDINAALKNSKTGDEVVEALEKLKPGNACQLEKIDNDNRLNAIRLLEEEDEEEWIIKLIASTTYNAQAKQLTTELFKDDGKMFHKLWTALDFSEFNQYVNKVTEIVKNDQDPTVTLQKFSFKVNGYESFDYEWDEDNGKIVVTKTSISIGYDPNTQSGTTSTSKVVYTYALDSLIEIEFPLNGSYVKFSDDQKEDQKVVLPAFYIGYLLYNKSKSATFTAIRVLGNIIAIVAAIPSAGQSLTVWAGVSIALAAGDIIMTIAEDELMKSNGGKEFVELWTYLQWADAGAGLVNVGKGVYKYAVAKGVTNIRFNPTELLAKWKSDPLFYKSTQKVLTDAVVMLQRINLRSVSTLLYTKLLARLDAEAIRAVYISAKNSKIDFKDWVEGIIEYEGKYYKLFNLEVTTGGGYVKATLVEVIKEGDELIGEFGTLRYLDETTGTIKEAPLKVGYNKAAQKVYLAKTVNQLKGIFKTFSKQQFSDLEVAIDKAVATIKQRGKESLFTDPTKTNEALNYLTERSPFATGDLVELPAKDFLKQKLKPNEEILLNVELRCYDAAGNTVGGSIREVDALKLNKSSKEIENALTMKLDEKQVPSGKTNDRESLRIFALLPDNGQNLRTFITTESKIGVSPTQVNKVESAKILFTELSTGKKISMTPGEFKNYFGSKTDFSSFNVEGFTPATLGTTKQELLEGALELIKKKL